MKEHEQYLPLLPILLQLIENRTNHNTILCWWDNERAIIDKKLQQEITPNGKRRFAAANIKSLSCLQGSDVYIDQDMGVWQGNVYATLNYTGDGIFVKLNTPVGVYKSPVAQFLTDVVSSDEWKQWYENMVQETMKSPEVYYLINSDELSRYCVTNDLEQAKNIMKENPGLVIVKGAFNGRF